MITHTSDLADFFWEDGELLGILYLNGGSHWFKTTPANKDYIRERLLVTDKKNTEPIKETVTKVEK